MKKDAIDISHNSQVKWKRILILDFWPLTNIISVFTVRSHGIFHFILKEISSQKFEKFATCESVKTKGYTES